MLSELTNDAKSQIIAKLTKEVPELMDKKGFDSLVKGKNSHILGFEDALIVEEAIKFNEKDKKDLDDKMESTSLSELFPNARISAEIDIAKKFNNSLYMEFKNKLFELDGITKQLDEFSGHALDLFLDEIKEHCNPKVVDAVKNLPVSIINIENNKIANK